MAVVPIFSNTVRIISCSLKRVSCTSLGKKLLCETKFSNDFFALDHSLLDIRMMSRKKGTVDGHFNPDFDNRAQSTFLFL